MWLIFARIIIRKRLFILALLLGLTGMFGYYTTKVTLSREFADLLPPTDTNMIQYKKMRKLFGEDGMVMVVAVQDKNIYQLKRYKAWYDLGNDLKKIKGVDSVFSEANMYTLHKDTARKKFELKKIFTKFPSTQAELDSIKIKVRSLPFYENLMYNPKTGTTIMMVFINAKKFNSKDRGDLIADIQEATEKYKEIFPDIKYSGLPLIRDTLFHSLRNELSLFVILSIVASALILYVFFRSFTVLFICMITVVMGLLWSFGTMGLLQFRVSALMSLIPPLMIVIAIPNCIYLINKYHQEYLKAKNKMKALTSTIRKLGAATFITNANTALGFATFLFTGNEKLMHFGIVSALNVMAMFFISLTIIPIIFSFFPPPSVKNTKHLEKKWSVKVVQKLIYLINYRRPVIYITTILISAVGVWGIFQMRTTGNIASDLPSNSKVVKDLFFLEGEFGGIMPVEIVINTKEPGQATKEKTLHKLDSIQRYLATDTIYSKSLSLADAVKFVNQAYYNGDPAYYTFFDKSDLGDLSRYKDSLEKNMAKGNFKAFLDSSQTITRITAQMRDIGSKEIDAAQKKLRPVIDSILNPDKANLVDLYRKIRDKKLTGQAMEEKLQLVFDDNIRFFNNMKEVIANGDTAITRKLESDDAYIKKYYSREDFPELLKKGIDKTVYDIAVTGTSTVFAQGTNYMIRDMIESLIFAIITISALMFFLFTSFKMILISLVPNIIPQILIAGIMGIFNIPIKPSTILVFSLAYGISVDNSIHFLAKYRQELKAQGFHIRECVMVALKETFLSQVYTSIVLFLGFSMFCFSSFGATVALGLLVSLSLFIAMFCNLIILPALLLSLDRYVAKLAFDEPFLSIYDEEEDVDLNELEVRRNEPDEPDNN